MRPLTTIDRPPPVARARGRFHIAALLVLFAALAWIADAQPEPASSRAADSATALQDGCRIPPSAAARIAGQAPSHGPCVSAGLPSR